MSQAFKPQGGLLVDPAMPAAEQQGVMHLFIGALALLRNPPAHREVDYDDPVEAAEVVLLADLLLRIVGRLPAPDASEAE